MTPRGLSLLITLLTLFLVAPVQAQSFYRPANPDDARAAFGGAAAIGEHGVFIGEAQSFKDPGLIHVFQRGEDGWAETAQLSASDGDVGDGFGQVIAVAGNTLLTSAAQMDSSRGAVYVFDRDAASDSWTQTARLTVQDAAAGDQLGAALAFNGDYALIGASRHNERAGAVYVFRRDAETGDWVEHDKLVGSEIEKGHRFGSMIVMAGDRALISASMFQAGAVYVYQLDAASGAWTEEARIVGNDVGVVRGFAGSIHLHGNEIFAGSPRSNQFKGSVHVFERDDASGAWTLQSTLTPDDSEERAFFGAAIQADDDLWIGAPGTSSFTGAVHRFERQADGWVEAGTLAAPEGQSGDFFAGALAVRGDVAVVGSAGADYGEGSAVILERDAETGAWAQQAVVFNQSEAEGLPPIVDGQVDCNDGEAASFACSQVDLISFLPLRDMGLGRGVRLNDVWGWTDPETGKEYALVGHLEAAVFVDISDPYNPVYLGQLLRTEGSPGSTWRDIKVYKDHAFIVADGAGDHGMQVFDLRQLRDVENPPVTFEVTAHYDNIASAHNIVINEETGFAFSVGSSGGGESCGGGLHMIDIREPAEPVFAGCFADPQTGRASTGYSHDAQCVIYQGPDVEHQGKEICVGANETAISISDVTDKDNPAPISTGAYPNFGYVHQGWLSDDHRYFYQNDELDELRGEVDRTRTLVWDVSDLDDPILAKEYFGEASSTDHNLYVRGNLMYQTNNASGLRIIDVSDPENPVEVGFFDTTPYGYNVAGFNGTWSSYPYFESGMIVVTSRREGLFIVKKREVDI